MIPCKIVTSSALSVVKGQAPPLPPLDDLKLTKELFAVCSPTRFSCRKQMCLENFYTLNNNMKPVEKYLPLPTDLVSGAFPQMMAEGNIEGAQKRLQVPPFLSLYL